MKTILKINATEGPPPKKQRKGGKGIKYNRYNGDSRKKLRAKLIERDGERCVDCGREDMLTLDHIIPISKGGKKTLENVQLLCIDCNQKKANPKYTGKQQRLH